MRIACDFDGVICKRVGIPTMPRWDFCEPVDGALESILLLQELGHEVWILTSNPRKEEIKKWLDKNNFPILKITNTKKWANVYIDDRGLRFTNWQDIRKYFS